MKDWKSFLILALTALCLILFLIMKGSNENVKLKIISANEALDLYNKTNRAFHVEQVKSDSLKSSLAILEIKHKKTEEELLKIKARRVQIKKVSIPVTQNDSIVYLERDVLACDSVVSKQDQVIAELQNINVNLDSTVYSLGTMLGELQKGNEPLKLALKNTTKQLRKEKNKKNFFKIALGIVTLGLVGSSIGAF